MRFKKGELTKEALKVLLFDLNALVLDERERINNDYHFNLLVSNLRDIFGDTRKFQEGLE